MKERPILFSAPMVRAILGGQKTQTRRVMKIQPLNPTESDWVICETLASDIQSDVGKWYFMSGRPNKPETKHFSCPFGNRDDQLWVRETYAPCQEEENHAHAKAGFTYRADWSYEDELIRDFKWKPCIFMTRDASRITLKVKKVSVQRLHDITEEDSLAEGITQQQNGTFSNGIKSGFTTARYAFINLWMLINGVSSLIQNPWVWVIKFERVQS